MGLRGPQARNALAVQRRGKQSGGTQPPADVAADPVALQRWTETVAALRELGLWHPADRPVVQRYCLMASAWTAAYRDVQERGPSMPTSTGYEALRPSAVQLNKLAAALLSLETALGLNAKARQRMSAVAGQPFEHDDPEAALLERLKVRV